MTGVSGPWWLWRHQYLRGHSLTLVGNVMHCSCGRSALVAVPLSRPGLTPDDG